MARKAEKALGVLIGILLFSIPAFAKPHFLSHYDDNSVLSARVTRTVQPGYRFVEDISDGVYGFVRTHVIQNLFPARMTRNLKPAPSQDSASLFVENLNKKQARFMLRARQSQPIVGNRFGAVDMARREEWNSWAADEQLGVAMDAIQDTLLERYQLELFGRATGAYAQDRRNWDPGFISMAGIFGGAFLYLNGMSATAHLGVMKVDFDFAPGQRLHRAMETGSAHSLGSVELGYKEVPLTLAMDWGLESRQLRSERVGLNYRLSF
ncbi:MAG TPA: hypothetical protein DEB40_05070 [Elusimicrobia bacterium]|nr:hypothetical protein [Elusimicrobiota bacterium]HBT61095.1 hypothetical protein [Elusimicrobiota bacterium]